MSFNFLKIFDIISDEPSRNDEKKKQSFSLRSFFNAMTLDNDNIDSELHNSKEYDKEGPSVDTIIAQELPNIDSFVAGQPHPEGEKGLKRKKRGKGRKKGAKAEQEVTEIKIGPQVPLIDVLKFDASLKLFRNGNKALINFLCVRMNDLIQMCFNKEDRELADKAYSIFLAFDHKIMHNFIRADRFQFLGAEIMEHDDPCAFKVGRFTSIISGILDTDPDSLIDQCGFLYRLIHHIDTPEISLLLIKFCKNDETLENLQKYLIKLGFDEMIYRELINYRSVESENDFQYYANKDVQRTAALYRLMASCLSSHILSKRFLTNQFITLCEIEYDPADRIIDDQKWLAILAFFTPQYAPQLLNFVYSAVMQLRNAKTQFYHCHYYALKFLSFMIKYSDATEDLLVETDFIPQLLRLLFAFNGSSFFQEVFRKFIGATLTRKKIISMIAQMVIPALMGMLSDDYNVGFKGTLCEIFEAIEAERKYNAVLNQELNQISNYKDFYDSRVVLRSYLISTTYGESYRGQLENLLRYHYEMY